MFQTIDDRIDFEKQNVRLQLRQLNDQPLPIVRVVSIDRTGILIALHLLKQFRTWSLRPDSDK